MQDKELPRPGQWFKLSGHSHLKPLLSAFRARGFAIGQFAIDGVQRALDPENTFGSFGDNMCVDHRGSHVLVSQQLLDSPDVISALQQVSGERMTEGMR